MNLSEIRYVFWDGVINVNDRGEVDDRLTCKQYYLNDKPPAIDRAKQKPPAANLAPRQAVALINAGRPGIPSTREERTILSNLVVPTIKVRVVQVDDWFVPVTDLLAIKLKLRFIIKIHSLMLRIRLCDRNGLGKIIYQEVFDDRAVLNLPKDDVSRREEAVKKFRRKRERDAAKAQIATCLTHCAVEVWISTKDNHFDARKVQDLKEQLGPYDVHTHDKSLPPDNPTELWRSLTDNSWNGEQIKKAKEAWDARIKHKRQKHAVKLGRNQTLVGCPLIEDIMADKTRLKVFDHEPRDGVYKDGKPVRGNGSPTFPAFRAKVRWAMYQICAHSRIAMALLRAVAEEPDSNKAIEIYPSIKVAKFIEGTAVGGSYPDDIAITDKVKQIEADIKAGNTTPYRTSGDPPWFKTVRRLRSITNTAADESNLIRAIRNFATHCGVDLGNQEQFTLNTVKKWGSWSHAARAIDNLRGTVSHGSFSTPVQVKNEITSKGKIEYDELSNGDTNLWENAQVFDDSLNFALEFASRRWLLRQIGAAQPGQGSGGHFYFHPFVCEDKLDRDKYEIYHHKTDASKLPVSVSLPDDNLTRTVNYAIFAEDSAGKRRRIETPFFLALAHEMIHARRMQLGLNAEYDAIKDTNPDAYHPHALVRQFRDQLRTNGVDPTTEGDRVNNLISRYNKYNREEFDTIEGGGVPVTLRREDFEALCRSNVIANTDIHDAATFQVKATENLIRKELKLNLRHYYEPGVNSTKSTPKSDVVADDIIKAPRKFLQASTNPNTLDSADVTPADVKREIDRLFSECSIGKTAIELKEGYNLFWIEPLSAYLPMRFQAVLRNDEDDNTINLIWKEMADKKDDLLNRLSPGASAELGTHLNRLAASPAPSVREKRLWLAELLLVLFKNHVPGGGGTTLTPDDYQKILSKDISEALSQKPEGDAQNPAMAKYNLKTIQRTEVATLKADPPLDKRATYLLKTPAEDTPQCLLHGLIHEPMHALSYEISGFNAWDLAAGPKEAGLFNVMLSTGDTNDSPALMRFLESLTGPMETFRNTQQLNPETESWIKDTLTPILKDIRSLTINITQKQNDITINRTTYAAAQAANNTAKMIELDTAHQTMISAKDAKERELAEQQDALRRELTGGQKRTLLRNLTQAEATQEVNSINAKITFPPVRADVVAANEGKFFWTQLRELKGPGQAVGSDMYFRIKNTLNEGATEVFSRIILYRLNHRAGRRIGEVKLLLGAPYYEYETHLVCQIIRDMKAAGHNDALELLAKAYYEGQWEQFNSALLDLSPDVRGNQFNNRYTSGFWGAIGTFSIYPEAFFDPQNGNYRGVMQLRQKFGICWPTPEKLREMVADGSYRDPVTHSSTLASNGDVIYAHDPIANLGCARGSDCPQCKEPRGTKPEIAARCPVCEHPIRVPSRAVLKI
jgi:hypothetical protein